VAFNVIAKASLRDFWLKHEVSQDALLTWYKTMTKADFKTFAELKNTFASADLIQPDYIIFNIKGNSYRLITRISFSYKTIWIKHIFTHAQYDRWRAPRS